MVLGLILCNGLFAGAEIAMLSVRKTRLKELADEGSHAARRALETREQPERFLATVQIGITVVSAAAAAFGGATVARVLASRLTRAGVQADWAEDFALGAVIVGISYASLVLGELVPKSLALRSAERYALLVARPFAFMANLARPLVWFLTASSNLILRLFRDETTFAETRLSKEELQQLVDEAATMGSVNPEAGEIAYRALEFGEVSVGALVVPRRDIVSLDALASRDEVHSLLTRAPHARLPVYEGTSDNVVGYVTSRDLVAMLAVQDGRQVKDVLRNVLFVPEMQRAAEVLREMRSKREHLAIVVDEEGAVTGLVTLEDLVEELVGEVLSEHEAPIERFRREPDGSILVHGQVLVHEANRELGFELPEGPEWTTMAGLAMARAGAIPKVGACIQVDPGVHIEVVEATDRRVMRVRLRSTRPSVRPMRVKT